MAALLSAPLLLTQLYMDAHMRPTQTCVHSHTHTLTQCPDFFLFIFLNRGRDLSHAGSVRMKLSRRTKRRDFASRVWRETRLPGIPNRSVLGPNPFLDLLWRPHISLPSSSVSVETSPFTILLFSSYPGGAKANV